MTERTFRCGKTDSPIRHFAKPREVLSDSTLSPRRKRQALDTREIDAEALQHAEDGGMGGGEPTRLIDTLEAKRAIGARSIRPKAK